jgi:Acetyltransferase (GNAT) domain
MKTLHRSEIPEDYSYYRTWSRVFLEYSEKFTGSKIVRIGTGYTFASAFQILPRFWTVSAEKIDTEIWGDTLRDHGIHHGILYWTPLRNTEKPKWWWRVPTWFTRWNIHASRSAFSVLDRSDYWMKWSPNARSHRKKVLEYKNQWKIRIDRNIPLEVFLELYKKTPVHDGDKYSRIRKTRKLFEKSESDYRIYVIFVDDRPLAGAIFIDEWVTSEYWVSWYHREGYPYHLGIAMMDQWFLDSYEKWIKYCDLDHMRDSWQSYSYAGYTKFKESIADYDVYFHDMWVKIF